MYAPELTGCSAKYVVFANERALMVYGRQEKKLLAALDLQALDCNYFNTDRVHTRVLLKGEQIYLFNEKTGSSRHRCMYMIWERQIHRMHFP